MENWHYSFPQSNSVPSLHKHSLFSPLHRLHRSSLQCWQEKQSLQLCFFSCPGCSSGTYIFPNTPGILTKGIFISAPPSKEIPILWKI